MTVTASPTTISQVAEVDGKLHVFLDNFGGIEAKRNPQPSVESGVVVSFPANSGSRIRILPFLGEESDLPAEHQGGQLIAKLPAFRRAIAGWCE